VLSDVKFRFETFDGDSYAITHELKTTGFLAEFDPSLKVYGFAFYPLFGMPDEANERIKPTILKAFADALNIDSAAIHFYIPDSSDLRHHARARMFDSWIDEMKSDYAVEFTQYTFKIKAEPGSNEQFYYWVFLIHDDNPLKEKFLVYVKEYIDSTLTK
jgi:hypothetical protein